MIILFEVTMILEEKREYILNKLNKNKIITVKDLSKELNCTDASIRYIVNDLANKKLLKRVHGGVAKEEKTLADISANILKLKNLDEKKSIASIAVNYISDNSTIILDSGTTNIIFSQKINNFSNLNILTNSIKIANILIEKSDLNIIIIGGVVRRLTNSIVHYGNESILKSFKANQLYLNIGALSIEEGLTDPSYQEAMIKRDMIEISSEIILLADSSKIGKVSLASVCPIEKIKKIITDKKINRTFIKKAEKLGIEVLF